MSAVRWNGLGRLLGAAALCAAAPLAALGCGSNQACDDLCVVRGERLHECCEALGTDWCLAVPGTQDEWVGKCQADFAVAIYDARVEDRNGVRNQCALDMLEAPGVACTDLIEHYDDLWEQAHPDETGDDDTVF